jgi:hypothetical protein
MTTTKITARNAKSLIGYTVHHGGEDLRIDDVRHMGRGGWMLALSNGAIVRPGEIR